MATQWGQLFGARARDWANTWEGPTGWGSAVYDHVLDRAGVGPATELLDCGCGAGTFLRLAASRGARVSGIDASEELAGIAAGQVNGDVRCGDLEALPWRADTFDVVTGLSSFQFARDHVRAVREASRVSRGTVVVVVPARVAESGIARVLTSLTGLFADDDLMRMRASGMYALSQPSALDAALAEAGLTVGDDQEVESRAVLADPETAVRAFLAAGAVGLAVRQSGEPAVAAALREGIAPLVAADGQVPLPGWYRVVVAS
jgi:SAM-dependent methyltransferase